MLRWQIKRIRNNTILRAFYLIYLGLITALEGITLEDAKRILAKARKEKLPIVDKDFNLKGLITIKDIEKQIKYPLSAKDAQGRLLCGAVRYDTN